MTSRFNFFCFVLLGLSTLLTATPGHSSDLDGYQINLSLPINATSTSKYNLSISVPKDYVALQDPKTFADKNTPMIEFIPQGEFPNLRSKIFTPHKIIGSSISASKLTGLFKTMFKQADPNLVILEDRVIANEGYEEAVLAMDYTHEGRKEVVYMHYYSGPYDTAGVQYVIVKKKGQSSDSALSTAEAFVKKSIKVVLCD